MMPFLRYSRWVAVAFLLLALIITMTTAWLFLGSLPHYTGRVGLAGLASRVDVYRDNYGVPHIFADNRLDALHALGYLHAGERFFQMEMQRRAGQGRLSEVVGPDMLGTDKFIRTLGLYSLAESSFAAMPPDSQQLFQAYADGVNDWLKAHRYSLPPEFFLLRINPEPWKPADSVVWGKLMALQLSHNYQLEKLRAQLAGKLSPAQMRSLFPPADNAPITMEPKAMRKAEEGETVFSPIYATSSGVVPAQAGIQPDFPQETKQNVMNSRWREDRLDSGLRRNDADLSGSDDSREILEKLASITSLDHAASNEWVIGGARTQSGKPVLANDPHLALEAPILWFLVRIVTPDFAVKGASVPGLPGVLLGQNNNIAWGMTTTDSDVEDLFVETVDPRNPRNYLTPQGSQPFLTHKEAIHIRGAETEVVTIRATRHGPVLSDLDPELAALAGPGKVMALAFTGLGDQDRTAEALMRVNMAANWQEFLAALRLYQGPPQNIVFADIKGDIGFIAPGLVPMRNKGDGTVPADGASGFYDWKGYIPFEEWPKLYNPAAGFVFNANNALVGANARHFYGVDWEEPYRAFRLQQLLDDADQQTLDSSQLMQADHVSLPARQMLPYLLRLRIEPTEDNPNPRAIEALDMLRGWDGTMDKNRPEPLIFEAWLYEMHQLMLVDQAKQPLKERGPLDASSIAYILNHKDNGWCGGEACDAISAQALNDAIAMLIARQGPDMKRWRWGKEHRAILQNNVFKHLPWLKTVSDLSVPSSGDFYTLDRGGSFAMPPDQPFARRHGGGYRGIYDLANPERSRFMITTGESGHIFSAHYGDLVPLWNDVKAITLTGTEQELAAQRLPMMEFVPAAR